jgi:ribosome maturation factor RimP
MTNQAIINNLEQVVGEYLRPKGIELVELQYRTQGRNISLRILVDNPEGGISLDECASLSYELGNIFEQNNIIQQRYILEVSSPGLDRPLHNKRDFERCLNKNVKFFLNGQISGKIEWDGVIKQVNEVFVIIDTTKAVLELPLDKIHKAKQIID